MTAVELWLIILDLSVRETVYYCFEVFFGGYIVQEHSLTVQSSTQIVVSLSVTTNTSNYIKRKILNVHKLE